MQRRGEERKEGEGKRGEGRTGQGIDRGTGGCRTEM